MRLVWIFLALAVVLAVPFLLWRDVGVFTPEGAVAWLREYGRWAWLAGIGLLVADLFLPVPGTAIMAALGFTYGPFVGGAVSAADLTKGGALFARWGAWLVVLSRWLPLFPEVIACMAGLTRMPPATFFLALACGSVPLGFTYAAIGHAGVAHPTLAVLVSAGLPPLLWVMIHRVLRSDPPVDKA